MDLELDLSELMATVTHEINNPLAGVIGFSQLASRAETPEKQRELLKLIEEQAQVCRETVSRIEAGFVFTEPNVVSISIIDLIETSTALHTSMLEASNVKLTTAIHGEPALVRVDVGMMHQAIGHLTENSCAAMVDNPGTKELRIEATVSEQQVEIVVADNGAGVPAEHVASVFLPTFSTRARGRRLGLGLFAVQRICQLHGGVVRLESLNSAGTRVVMRLPVV